MTDGGCPILDYAVYRYDDSTLVPFTNVNPSPTYTRNDPYTLKFTCTMFPALALAGDSFSFFIVATNQQGSVQSLNSPPFILADKPGTPAAGPSSDATVTNQNQIKVTFSAVGSDGGSTILSYEVQKGTTALNDFETIVGGDPYSLALQFTVTKGIVKGQTYTFRYRAINKVGAGEWSDITQIVAASVPAAPPQPTYDSSTDTTITINLTPTTDNGGSKILEHRLYRDDGDLSTDITFHLSLYDRYSL